MLDDGRLHAHEVVAARILLEDTVDVGSGSMNRKSLPTVPMFGPARRPSHPQEVLT